MMSKANKGVQPGFVVSKTEYGTGNNMRFRCFMSDGSYWTCDSNGEDWEKDGMSPDELTKKFKEFIKNNEE